MSGMTAPFRHPRQSSAGIHLKKGEDGFPIKNVGNDEEESLRFAGSPFVFNRSPVHHFTRHCLTKEVQFFRFDQS
jgi:hypothetical protein